MNDFFTRFSENSDQSPISLQVLFPELPDLSVDAVTTVLRGYHLDLASATIELIPAVPGYVSKDGPSPTLYGLFSWGQHVVKMVAFDVPMPYGPVESAVLPAMMSPELKEEAKNHRAHMLLYYGGTHPDPLEHYVAVAAVSGAMARLGASVVLNEEARSAAPAYDLVPDPEEDGLKTLRDLPMPYLYVGFLRMDAGDADRIWVRTFTAHRIGLPNLAYQTSGPGDIRGAFELISGLLGYLRRNAEKFQVGDMIDLEDGVKYILRAPSDAEWFLESDGVMLVLEPTTATV